MAKTVWKQGDNEGLIPVNKFGFPSLREVFDKILERQIEKAVKEIFQINVSAAQMGANSTDIKDFNKDSKLEEPEQLIPFNMGLGADDIQDIQPSKNSSVINGTNPIEQDRTSFVDKLIVHPIPTL